MRVLIVGKSDDFINTARNALQQHGAEVNCCEPSQALGLVQFSYPDVVCIDTSIDGKFFFLDQLLFDLKKWSIDPMVVGITTAGVGYEAKSCLYKKGFDLLAEESDRLFFEQISAYKRRLYRLGLGTELITSEHIEINVRTQDIYLKTNFGEIIDCLQVQKTQFQILKILIRQPKAVWSRIELAKEIAKDVGSEIKIDERSIDKAIYKIRKTIEQQLISLQQGWTLLPAYKHPFVQTQARGGYFFHDAIQLPSDKFAAEVANNTIPFTHLQAMPVAR